MAALTELLVDSGPGVKSKYGFPGIDCIFILSNIFGIQVFSAKKEEGCNNKNNSDKGE
jgi:hypothetical protein